MSTSEGHEPASETSDAAAASPLEVLEHLSLDDVYSLGSEGSEPVDWAALVPDRSGLCPDCGLADGPRHHDRCIAHPRPPSFWWPVGATAGLAAVLALVVGPGAFLFFAPLLLLGYLIRAR
ncbi:MAG TPA: hypothetical protein VFL59_13235 [Candidatus Nanopelagicales bacterium]|nr:hypothetical protein [Candidatus Nanopelagicales bacterium]